MPSFSRSAPGVEAGELSGNLKASAKRKKYCGPESDFFDKCKGKVVRIAFVNEKIPPLTATLAWVDRFTVGVRREPDHEQTMLYKRAILSIERDEDDRQGPLE